MRARSIFFICWRKKGRKLWNLSVHDVYPTRAATKRWVSTYCQDGYEAGVVEYVPSAWPT